MISFILVSQVLVSKRQPGCRIKMMGFEIRRVEFKFELFHLLAV